MTPKPSAREALTALVAAWDTFNGKNVPESLYAAISNARAVLATAPAEPNGLTNEQFSDAEHAAFNAREIVEKLVCAVATEGFFGSEMAPRGNCKCWNCLNARVLNACATSINAALNVIANGTAHHTAPAEPPKDGEVAAQIERLQNVVRRNVDGYWMSDADRQAIADAADALARLSAPVPIPMVLHCPQCSKQHIDAPQPERDWTNPPHRSHECQFCGFVWRPADVATTGVQATQTHGSRDSASSGNLPRKPLSRARGRNDMKAIAVVLTVGGVATLLVSAWIYDWQIGAMASVVVGGLTWLLNSNGHETG